jgi:hypothetical protein
VKFCNNCGETKEYSEFYKRTKSPDGYQHWCRICLLADNKRMAESRYKNGPTIIRDSKVCRDCGLKKPINAFYRKKSSADGRGSYCAPCWSKRVQGYVKKAKERKNNR